MPAPLRPLTAALLALLALSPATPASARPPALLRLVPAPGDRAVRTATPALELHFDMPMGPGIALDSDDMPEITGAPRWDSTRTILRIPVKLVASHAYQLILNPGDNRDLANAAHEALPTTVWKFRTEGPVLPDDLDDPAMPARLAAIPVERRLAGGRLRVSHVYALQAQVLLECRGLPDSVLAQRMIERVYRPYATFWQGYVGSESAFRDWVVQRFVAESHPVRKRLRSVLDLDLDAAYVNTEAWIARTTGLHPKGHWVLIFGHGATDMGGLAEEFMLMDFTALTPSPEAVTGTLPHELAHQVNGLRRPDPDGRTVLGRVIGEGVACYASFVHEQGARSPASCVGYADTTWARSVAQESRLWELVRPGLASRDRDAITRVASRSEQLDANAPPAVGYFLGFRIVQAYVARHGEKSWTQVLRLPVRTVLARSGYAPQG